MILFTSSFRKPAYRILFVGAFGAALFASSAANAQTQTAAKDPGYTENQLQGNDVVVFHEDIVGAPGGNIFGDTIRRPPGTIRIGLVKPRYNFVSEMIKSVENI